MQDNKTYQIIKTNDTYDPEGLNIPSPSNIVFTGDYESAFKKFNELENNFRNEIANRPKALNTYMLMTLTKLNDTTFKVYYGSCQSNVYYKLQERREN